MRVLTCEGHPEALQGAGEVLELLRAVVVPVGVELDGEAVADGGDVLDAGHDGPTVPMLLVVLAKHHPVCPTAAEPNIKHHCQRSITRWGKTHANLFRIICAILSYVNSHKKTNSEEGLCRT